jgi:hypothetical protein
VRSDRHGVQPTMRRFGKKAKFYIRPRTGI